MKLRDEELIITQKFESFIAHHGMDKCLAYIEQVRASGEYQNFEVRIVHDFLRYALDGAYVMSLYEKYGCHDSHLFTIGKKVFNKFFTI